MTAIITATSASAATPAAPLLNRSSTASDNNNNHNNKNKQWLETQRRRKGEINLPSFTSNASASDTASSSRMSGSRISPPSSPAGGSGKSINNKKKKSKKVGAQSSFYLYQKPGNLTPKRCEKIVKYAKKRLRGHDDDDEVKPKTQTSVLTHSQIELGEFLGKGAFSSVYAIKSINDDDNNNDNNEQTETIVVKFLRTRLYDNHGLFAASACDLVKEGQILSQLNHVNVIRLHAVSSLGGVDSYVNGYHDSYFLVLERLEGTLAQKIDEWKSRHTELYESYTTTIQQVLLLQQQQRAPQPQDDDDAIIASPSWMKRLSRPSSSSNSRTDDHSEAYYTTAASDSYSDDEQQHYYEDESIIISDDMNSKRISVMKRNNKQSSSITTSIGELLEERLNVAIQLADAITYLHKMNVVHRDLKPDNLGFDRNGVLKVFDFDIARVAPKSKTNDENETFLMTQKVGSPRYMSPECAKKEPYNLKTDVYTYGLLFHQILTLEKPYDDIEDDEHDLFVFHRHVRPAVPDSLPKRTKQLMFRSWAPIVEFRPNMNQVSRYLKEDRTDIVRSGTPPSLSSVVSILEGNSSSSVPPMIPADAPTSLSPSMSYVSSCEFESFSDCNVVVVKKTKKEKNNNKMMNTLLNTVVHSPKNNNNNNNKNNNRRSIIPSTIRHMFGGRGNNNKDAAAVVVGVEPSKQLQLDMKKNLPQQSHSSGHFAPPIATRVANAKAA